MQAPSIGCFFFFFFKIYQFIINPSLALPANKGSSEMF